MPLPTPEQYTDRGVNNLDSLLQELAVPKEEINNHRPGQQAPGNAATPNPGTAPEPGFYGPEGYDAEPAETMPEEVAQLSGKTIANTIDQAAGTGFSLYAKSKEPEKYQATEKQLQNLENAWAAVAKKYNYRVEDSPWFNVIILTVAVYLPYFQAAKADRRFAEMDERLKEQQRQIQANEARLKQLEDKAAA